MSTGLLVGVFTGVLVLSAMYMLAALGFAFIFNMLGIINFAHGSIYMLGAYICYTLVEALGINSWLALVLTVIISFGIGLILERICFRPFVKDFTRVVMVCVAIIVISQTTVNILAGTKTQAIRPFVLGTVSFLSQTISLERVVTLAIGLCLLALIVFFVRRTTIGMQMEAIAQNRTGAELQGIYVHRVSAYASVIGCALAVIAGSLMGAYLTLTPSMGGAMLGKVLMLVMLAGAGSTGGIFITGLVLGGLDAILPIVLSGATSDAVAVGAIIVLLLIRPQGFFGHEA